MEAVIDRSFILNLPAVQAVMQLESNLRESRVLLAVANVLQSLSDARQVWETGSASGLNSWAAQSLQAKAILKELDASSDDRTVPDANLSFKFVDQEQNTDVGGKSRDTRRESEMKSSCESPVPSWPGAGGGRGSGNADLCTDGETSTATSAHPGSHSDPAARGGEIVQKSRTGHVTKARELKMRLSAARQENQRLKSRQWCRLCRQRPVELTLLPCGHFLLCVECGSTLTECPVCDTTILADVRTIVS